jgi:hypothetical protein
MKAASVPCFVLGALLASAAHAGNGGTTCTTAVSLSSISSYTADTTAAPNWMSSFGPLVSPSNDVVYTFVAPADPSNFSVNPIATSYQFALYLIPSCNDPIPPNPSASEPTPIGATATVGGAINASNLSTPLIPGNQYFLAATGTAAGGATANGTVSFQLDEPVSLQSFDVQ